MEPLKSQRIFHYPHNEKNIIGSNSGGLPLSTQRGHEINSYQELLEKISALNFYNRSQQIFFRGQIKDYFNNSKKGKPVRSNLYPSLLRNLPTSKIKRRERIKERLRILEKAECLLKDSFSIGYIHKHKLVRWAILQHYEVCETPLLDITSSLQSALSFAVPNGSSEGHLFVLAFPHQTGPISVSLESMTQIVDLSKLCPPEALRPHFQSGLLAADYPSAIDGEELARSAPKVGGNFACRLLTKFHLKNVDTWVGKHFHPTPNDIIYPNERDKWYQNLTEIKEKLNVQLGH
jgi:FRG domain-containing protein